ncbi:hypothetical protein Taro_043284 [Colocasia esculenta]|uniref:Protein kinase domain-containing protein n=1 Tax=Colocasia esculenta TaxID=4460 RepID=A0A843WVC0_COLES|nr:hypothetical protein [Colocasia esculenta]
MNTPSLDSPHVVRCMGHECSGRPDGEQRFNLFMEYMAGGSLSDILHRFGGTLDETVVRTYTKEILQDERTCHSRRVAAAGFAAALSPHIASPSPSPWHRVALRPPQPARKGKGDGIRVEKGRGVNMRDSPVDGAGATEERGAWFAADILSLGCTVIEMATGRPPTWGVDELPDSTAAAVFRIAYGDDKPRFPTGLSEEGVDFLSRCLQRDPRLRWDVEGLPNHPFVTGNYWEDRCPCNGNAGSPTSILGEGRWCLEEADDSSMKRASGIGMRLPVTARRMEGEGRRQRCDEMDVAESGSWLLVRSDCVFSRRQIPLFAYEGGQAILLGCFG